MKWIAVKERESQQWKIVGPTAYYYEGKGRKKKIVHYSWVIPVPEHISPFIEAHKVIDANTKEEALCQILNLK